MGHSPFGRRADNFRSPPINRHARSRPACLKGAKVVITSAFENYEMQVELLAVPGNPRRYFIVTQAQSAHLLQPINEDITLEALIEPKLLITVGRLGQVFLEIGGEFAH
jgi:hypothetical protein